MEEAKEKKEYSRKTIEILNMNNELKENLGITQTQDLEVIFDQLRFLIWDIKNVLHKRAKK